MKCYAAKEEGGDWFEVSESEAVAGLIDGTYPMVCFGRLIYDMILGRFSGGHHGHPWRWRNWEIEAAA